MAVSSEQVYFLSTMQGKPDLPGTPETREGIECYVQPLIVILRLDDFILKIDVFLFETRISYVKDAIAFHYCSHNYPYF